MPRRSLHVVVILLAACARTQSKDHADAAAPSRDGQDAGRSISEPRTLPSASGAARSDAATSRRADWEAPPVEALRSRLKSLDDDHGLARHAAVLRSHWNVDGGRLGGLRVQSSDVTGGSRRVLLVESDPPDARPFVFLVDAGGSVVWTKERPTAGILPPVGQIAIAPGPLGRVLLAVCDPPTKSVAAREWDEDGSAFADFQALVVDACDEVSVFYWQHHGWVIVAVGVEGARAQLLTESGSLAWGGSPGLSVAGGRFRVAAPVSIATDTPTSVVFVQSASVAGVDHALAYRYDERGRSLWPTPIDLGATPLLASRERIVLERRSVGFVRAVLPGAALEIASTGVVESLSR